MSNSPTTLTQEKHRLTELRRLHVLDSASEERFDRIAHTVRRLLGTAAAFVSFVDENRIWNKSCVGMDLKEMARGTSFCTHAIDQHEELMVVPDTTKDERFSDNPLVMGDPGFRFYAGRVLRTAHGAKIGTLCVLDTKPFAGTIDDLWPLRELGAWVEAEIFNTELAQHYATKRDMMEMQRALLDAAKWTSIGELTASICHEISTPLGALGFVISDLKDSTNGERITDKEAFLASITNIETMAQNIRNIVRGLKAITRNDSYDPFVVASTSEFAQNAVALLKDKLKRANVSLIVDHSMEQEDIAIECWPAQIQQVLVNLIANAVDAVEELPERWVKLEMSTTDEDVAFRVVDSGKGIPAEIANRLMEPFFTTKPSGKGTGLGLSISRRIAEHHGGTLSIDQNSANTCFELRIPRKNRQAPNNDSSAA